MSNKIFIITVFIGNIAFGSMLPETKQLEIVKAKSTNKLSEKINTQLFNHGLDKSIAKTKVDNVLIHDDSLNALMVQNILKNIPSLKEADIVNFIAQAAMNEKAVDLSSYATLISLVQKHTSVQQDKELYLHVEKTSLENEKLKAMKVFA